MNRKIYWKIRKIFNQIKFNIIRKIYGYIEKLTIQKETFSLTLFIIKEVLKRTLLEILFLLPIVLSNNFLSEKILINIDNQYMLDFLYAGTGIVGVILGLYCANISSIYASIYTNAPLNLSKLFSSDIVSNKSIKQITGYLIFNLLLVFLLLTKIIETGLVLVIAVVISTIYIIVSFSINGNRSLILSNTFSISNISYHNIFTVLKKLSSKSIINSDINIQNHFRIKCSKELNNLKEIAHFNKEIPTTQNSYMKDFACDNLRLLFIYLDIKLKILNSSYWFEEIEEYNQWYNSASAEITTALNTGTMINNKKTKNYNWFEEKLLSVNEFCVKKFINDESYDCLYCYISLLSKKSKYFINSNTSVIYVNHIITIFGLLKDKISEQKYKHIDDTLVGIYELLIICYMDITIELRTLLKSINLCDLKKEFLNNLMSKKNHEKYLIYFNDDKLQRLKKCIETELKIEGKIITADWYIEQFISEAIYNMLCSNISILVKYLKEIDNELYFLENQKIYESACLVLCKFSELKSKSDNLINDITDLLEELNSKHFEKTIIWKDIQLDEYKDKLKELYINLPNRFRKNVIPIAIDKWNSRKNVPDYIGQCYNITCSIIIEAITENDIDKFKLSYENFLELMLLYYEYIRYDLIKIKEPHLQNGVLYSIAQPMLEYSIISGLAILWGEFSKETQWGKFVESKIAEFINKVSEFKTTFELWVTLLMETKSNIIGIGNRDILHTAWELKVKNSIEDNNLVSFEDIGYGNKVVKSESKIINCFCKSNFDIKGFTDPEDVFCLVCLNKYLDNDKKYHSHYYDWEKYLNEK